MAVVMTETSVRDLSNPATRSISNTSAGSGTSNNITTFPHIPGNMPPLPQPSSLGGNSSPAHSVGSSPELLQQPLHPGAPHSITPKNSVSSSVSHSNLNSHLSNSRPASKRAISQSVSTSNLNGNLSAPSSLGDQPTLGGRRSSFGLNFLSTFTNSIRTSAAAQSVPASQGSGNSSSAVHGPPSPTEHPHIFMSNSPTIANLGSYTAPEEPAPASSSGRRHQLQNTHLNDVANNRNISNTSPTGSAISNLDYSESVSQPPAPRLGSINTSSSTDIHNLTHISNEETRNQNPLALQDSDDSKNALLESTSNEKANGMDKDGFFSVRLTPLIDHSSSTSGLYFSPVIRKIKPTSSISIGRYTEKNKAAAHAPQGSSAPVVFKSKVVSRTHALFQCNEDGQWFLKDCKSSSGTFLNHVRLSPASEESSMMPLIDGDIIQLGMDYRGGTEEVYRCVKMRCEFNRSWQRKVNQFNLEIHKKLKNLQLGNNTISSEVVETIQIETKLTNPLVPTSLDDLAECAICLMKIEPCQALFISPCSHAWHYKCIRPIIIKSYPQFYCPNCRTMCDLETDLDEED